MMALLIVVVIFLIYLFVGFGCGLPGEHSDPVTRFFGLFANAWYRMVKMCRIQ